jgi:hypothetical protein
MAGSTLVALDDVIQEFRYRVDAGNQQMIPGAGAGDIEQVALGVINFPRLNIAVMV